MERYAIGIDFGTLSGRAALVRLSDGEIITQDVQEYAHGVMDETLPDGTRLPPDWALQDPQDYLDTLFTAVPNVVKAAGIDPAQIVGLSLDFTSCTILPLDARRQPLCFQPRWKNHPHALVKLWKHHGAQTQADRMTEIAQARGEAFLARVGGKGSSEWQTPKLMEILDAAPEIYEEADCFMEAGDWITALLTGQDVRSSCFAGYKGLWHKQTGYPSKAFYRALGPRLENVVEEKLGGKVDSVGGKAGELLPEMAQKLGLLPGTAVGVPFIDAHVAVPAVGVSQPGELLLIMGRASAAWSKTACCRVCSAMRPASAASVTTSTGRYAPALPPPTPRKPLNAA